MTSFIDHKIKEDMADNLRILATKQDLAEGLAAVRGELAEGLAAVRGEIGAVKGSLIAKIAETKSEMIKWMFIFWASQLTITLGFIHFFLKR
jgi:hypothetical protein